MEFMHKYEFASVRAHIINTDTVRKIDTALQTCSTNTNTVHRTKIKSTEMRSLLDSASCAPAAPPPPPPRTGADDDDVADDREPA